MGVTHRSREPLGDWLRREVVPRLSVELVYGSDAKWRRAGAWRTRPCPLHGGRRDSFHVHPDTLAWKCHSKCQDAGDVVAFVMRRDGVGFVDAARHLAGLVGEEFPDPGPRGPYRRPAAPRRPTPRPPPSYARPPAAEVAALWAAAQPVTSDPEASAYLESRSLEPAVVEERDLARVLPPGVRLPRWSHGPGGLWTNSGHRFVLPMYGATGRLESIRARLLRTPHGDELKALAPRGAQVAGLLLSDALGRQLLAGDIDAVELVRRAGVWIAEGEPDFLTLSTAWSDSAEDAPAVLGIVSGTWTPQLAARVPNGCTLTLATDADAVGDKYAGEVVATLAARMRAGGVKVERWQPRRGTA